MRKIQQNYHNLKVDFCRRLTPITTSKYLPQNDILLAL